MTQQRSAVVDLRPTIVPKSDQLNADDLIGQTKTITITSVRLCGEPDQPVAVHFEGDNGKPYKPGKSMRRVLVKVWGDDASAFVGRRMTLYRDDSIKFGGLAVGGIRISHMSDIDREIAMVLTESRANRRPFTVKPLPYEQASRPVQPQEKTQQRTQANTSELTLAQRADMYEERLKGALTVVKANAIRAAGAQLRDALDAGDPERLHELEQLFNDRIAFLEDAEREAAKGGDQ